MVFKTVTKLEGGNKAVVGRRNEGGSAAEIL